MSKENEEAQLLQLLKQILPQTTSDTEMAGKVYKAAERALRLRKYAKLFREFAQTVPLPDLSPGSVTNVQGRFEEAFPGWKVTLTTKPKEKLLRIDTEMPDGAQFNADAMVGQGAESDKQEIKLKFIAFPVARPGDKELIWLMAKREDLSNEEAGIALTKAEEVFWESKAGQKCLRDRVERSFAEFITRVPGGLLKENGLKRHYKKPEALKVLRS